MQCEMLWHVESGAFIVLAGLNSTDTYTIMPQDNNPLPLEPVWLLFKGPDIAHPLCGPTSLGACVQTLYDHLAPDAVDSRKIAKVEVTGGEGGAPLDMTVTMAPNVNTIKVINILSSDGVIAVDLPDGTTGDMPSATYHPWPEYSQLPPESAD